MVPCVFQNVKCGGHARAVTWHIFRSSHVFCDDAFKKLRCFGFDTYFSLAFFSNLLFDILELDKAICTT